jgi:glycosyltransferase involved in cell wall biosynthesis
MATPTVSVVIPAYNHAAFLGQTIASALAQSWRDLEVIVVDDGSSDNTAEVAGQFGGSIRYFRQQNRGMAGCRNTAVRKASGEFIGFLDDDDLWTPEYLTTVIPVLQSNPGLAACHTGSQVIDGSGKLLPQTSSKTVPSDRMYDALIDGGFFPPCSVTVRRACLDTVGLFDEGLQGCADWDMWLRVSQRYGFAGIPAVLVYYRVHGGGLSSNIQHMFTDNLKAAAKHFGPNEGDPRTWPESRRRAYAGAYFTAALGYFQRGEVMCGQDHLAEAWRLYPPMVKRLDVLYELACADQPRGWRGDFSSYDLAQGRQALFANIGRAFEAPDTPSELQIMRPAAYGNAYLALAMLSDQRGDWSSARRYMRGAVRAWPSLLRSDTAMRRLLKLHAGRKIVGLLRRGYRQAGNAAS